MQHALVAPDARRAAVAIEARIKAEQEKLAALEASWKKEKDLVDRILALRAKLRGPSGTEPVSEREAGVPAMPTPAPTNA